MNPKPGFHLFKEELCDQCGLCFQQCPLMELPKELAKEEVRILLRKDFASSLVLQRCVTCNVCELVCPQDASPYGLVLDSYHDYGLNQSLPFMAKFIFPNEPENMWTTTRVLMSEDERSLLQTWEENLENPRDEMLITGFYNNLVPYITQSSLLEELKPAIAGSDTMFGMGEDAYRIGYLEEAERLGRLAIDKFNALGVKKLYCFMVVEASMFTDVLPKRFGLKADFQVELLDNWLLERLKKGAIRITEPLKMKVAVHDNCCGRYMDGKLQDITREILDRIGCEVVEMPYNRNKALCCGWAGTIPTLFGPTSGNPIHTLLNLMQGLEYRLREAESTGAEVLVVPCPGCYVFFSLIKELVNSKMDIYLPLELIQMAAGETPVHKNKERAWDIFAVTNNLILKWFFSPKRFNPRPIDIEKPLPLPGKADARRIRFFGRFYHSFLVQNRLSRRLLAFLIKTIIARYRVHLKKKERRLIRDRAGRARYLAQKQRKLGR
ncbi:MAG: (Fe-S)-binding protein [Firmicutes bacterium]|nr:(Fe-S)-binding protein [Bacillota bacterium]